MKTASRQSAYPSDLTNKQWEQISVVIPPEKDLGRHRSTDVRAVVDGINYRWRTGCVWRMLPHDFPPWATIYTYFRRWQRDGTLQQIREVLLRRSPMRSIPSVNRKTSPLNRNSPQPLGNRVAESTNGSHERRGRSCCSNCRAEK